jgi:hypothetical protein
VVALASILLSIVVPMEVRAQAWNDARTRSLVELATQRRARQLADTGLADYTATAHGYLTFLAQLGEGFPEPPKIIKADEIALEVYWRAPSYSKQWIVGRRDTLLVPTDIQYHRDHLGIVQNNFPNIIRLGEGDEVRDVPHPLSASGMATYDFAIADSMRIGIPGRTIDVYEVKLRPRMESAAAAVGAIYLARDDAQVVRMAFSFTRAALLDRELEDVSIVLENALIEGRFWLPRRQEIEIRRTGSWLDFPARGIIRGRWEICCYRINSGTPAEPLTGPEIVLAAPAVRAAHRWQGAILDSLPADVRAITDRDVSRIQAEARSLVRGAALARARQTSLSAARLSDALRFTRAEGLSLGAGVRRRVGAGFDVSATARFGLADHEPQGSLSMGHTSGDGDATRLRIFREYRNAGDEPEVSGVRNTIGAQEFGADYTDPFDARGFELAMELHRGGGRWRVSTAYEWADSVRVAARPVSGRFEPVLPVPASHGPRASIQYDHPGIRPGAGTVARLSADLRVGQLTSNTGDRQSFARIHVTGQLERAFGSRRLLIQASGGAASGVAVQDYLLAGGPVSGPGYAYHAFAGRQLLVLHGEWQTPAPFIPLPLGRWGRIPGRALIVPEVHLLGVAGSPVFRPIDSGWYPSAGFGLIPFSELLRFDVVRGLRGGRWRFSVDVARDFWRIM